MSRLVAPSNPNHRDIWQFPRIFQPPMPDRGEQVFFKTYTHHHAVHREEELAQLVKYFQERLIDTSQSFNFAIISGLEGTTRLKELSDKVESKLELRDKIIPKESKKTNKKFIPKRRR